MSVHERELSRAPGVGSLLNALRRLGGSAGTTGANRAARGLPSPVPDLIPGSEERGRALLANLYDFGGYSIRVGEGAAEGRAPWLYEGAGEHWLAEMQGFGWLRDLRSVGGGEALACARALVLDWIERHESVTRIAAWQPELAGARITAWLANGEFLLRGADRGFADRFHDSLAMQTRHLARTARNADEGLPRLVAVKGMILGALAMPDGRRRAAQGIKLLDATLERQIARDGSHAERSPSSQLAALRHLFELGAALEAAGQGASPGLSAALGRIVPALRVFRHSDGGLALFNGGIEENASHIESALAPANGKGSVPSDAPEGGFSRIEGGRATLITDLGAPPSLGRQAHAGTLSFEMSAGGERLIVNCGAWRGNDTAWRQALRSTAAHSTLAVDGTDSAALDENDGSSRSPLKVTRTRNDREAATWLDASHDGYVARFGLMHRRRLYAAAGGADVRGEDTLTRIEERKRGGKEFAVRFHLHPDVRCVLADDGKAALLQLPSGARWRLSALGAAMGVDESVYVGDGTARRPSRQVVLAGRIGETAKIKWAVRHLSDDD